MIINIIYLLYTLIQIILMLSSFVNLFIVLFNYSDRAFYLPFGYDSLIEPLIRLKAGGNVFDIVFCCIVWIITFFTLALTIHVFLSKNYVKINYLFIVLIWNELLLFSSSSIAFPIYKSIFSIALCILNLIIIFCPQSQKYGWRGDVSNRIDFHKHAKNFTDIKKLSLYLPVIELACFGVCCFLKYYRMTSFQFCIATYLIVISLAVVFIIGSVYECNIVLNHQKGIIKKRLIAKSVSFQLISLVFFILSFVLVIPN